MSSSSESGDDATSSFEGVRGYGRRGGFYAASIGEQLDGRCLSYLRVRLGFSLRCAAATGSETSLTRRPRAPCQCTAGRLKLASDPAPDQHLHWQFICYEGGQS